MTTEVSFCFNDLDIDPKQVIKQLGYKQDSFPDPFPDYLEQAFQLGATLDDICGAFIIVDNIAVNHSSKYISASDQLFNVGKTIAEELKGSSRLAFFVCSAGKTISNKSEQMFKGDNPVMGYFYDVLGTVIVEAVGDKLQQMIANSVKNNYEKVTNRYSPGYCHWNVADQHKLFSLFDKYPCGVQLTSSALMNPVKSISGVIGVGRDVEYHDYHCNLCKMENCFYREVHRLS